MFAPVRFRPLVALVAALASPLFARADTLDAVVKAAAEEIKAECKMQNESQVVFGVFNMPARNGATTGPGIDQKLIDALGALNIKKLPAGAKITVQCKGVFDKNNATIKITFDVEDDSGTVLRKIPKTVTDKEDVARLMGVTSYTPPERPQDVPKALADAITDPKPVITQGTRITDTSGKYGFEVLVDGKPRDVKKGAGGLAYVELTVGEVYTIKLYNDSDHKVNAAIVIDGLSVNQYAKGPKSGGRIVPKGGTSEVRGWYIDSETSRKFQVGKFEHDELKDVRQGAIATITISFANFYEEGEKMPADEPGAAGDPLRTLPGQDQKDPTKLVKGSRGKLRGVASVRYEQPMK